jgi:flagellar FliJ protein
MRKEQRLDTYRQSLDRTKDERAARVLEANQRVESARLRLEELKRYREEYARALPTRIAQGLGAAVLLDYQSFMCRLTNAIDAQQDVLRRTQQERDFGVERLREVAVQHHAVSAVITRWQEDARRVERRRDQRASDERAQQASRHPFFQEAS